MPDRVKLLKMLHDAEQNLAMASDLAAKLQLGSDAHRELVTQVGELPEVVGRNEKLLNEPKER